MSDKLDASAAKALDKITNAVDAVVAKLGTLAEKYGPDVVDSALWVIRLDGIQTIAIGVVFGLVSLACGMAWRKLYAAYKPVAAEWRHYYRSSSTTRPERDENDYQIGLTILAIITAGLFIVAAIHLLSFWSYVAIFEPKLWVAKRLLGL